MRMKLAVAALAAACLGASAAHAAGARLFDSTDFVPRASEAATLTAAEQARVAKLRTMPFAQAVTVLKTYPLPPVGNTVSMTLPGGQSIDYQGGAAEPVKFTERHPTGPVERTITGWVGRSPSGTLITGVEEDGTMSGSVTVGQKNYLFSKLPGGPRGLLIEVYRNPNGYGDGDDVMPPKNGAK